MIDHLEALLEEQEQPQEAEEVLRLPAESLLPGRKENLEAHAGEKTTPAEEQKTDGDPEPARGEAELEPEEEREQKTAQELEETLGKSGVLLLSRQVARAIAGETEPAARRTVVEVREREWEAPAVDIWALDRQFRVDARRYDGSFSIY